MNVLEAIVLGIVQGLSEFLPISSSGHLLLVQKLFGIEEPSQLVTVLLHVGTLAAVIAVFWRDWLQMLKNPFKSHLFYMLVIATLPIVIATLLFGDVIDGLSSGWFLGWSFLITAALLFIAEGLSARLGRCRGRHTGEATVEQVTPGQAAFIGTMQAVGVLPGVSRSGATIVGGLLSGLPRATAAKFSFMMSVPAILGSLAYEVYKLLKGTESSVDIGALPMAVGVVAAAICGYLAIRLMLRVISRSRLWGFGAYVAVLGILVLIDQNVTRFFF